jgi:hypothetical protein
VDIGITAEQRRLIEEAGPRLIVAGEAPANGSEGFQP